MIPHFASPTPIPGTSSIDHLRQNLVAAELKLPVDAVKRLDGMAGN